MEMDAWTSETGGGNEGEGEGVNEEEENGV